MRKLLAGLVFAVSLAAASPALASYDVSANCQSNGVAVSCDGWHANPIQVYWTWSPSTSGSPSPGTCETQSFGSDTSTVVSCVVSGAAGVGGTNQNIAVETSAPSANATLTRSPDLGGWYNHPVSLSLTGSSYSGIASCSNPTYSGPAGANVVVSGSCVDNAGKTATASVSLNYDSVPPTIAGVSASRKPDAGGYYTHPVNFTFQGTDATSGVARCQTVSYAGPGSGDVVGGCWDWAGNYASISVPVRYRRSAPRASVARSGSSLVLRWKGAARAGYYNVQIFRGGRKVLSAWPARTSLVLRRSWSFAGHRFRLKPGRYRWYVWPGYGSRSSARYGRMLVSSAFRVGKRG